MSTASPEFSSAPNASPSSSNPNPNPSPNPEAATHQKYQKVPESTASQSATSSSTPPSPASPPKNYPPGWIVFDHDRQVWFCTTDGKLVADNPVSPRDPNLIYPDPSQSVDSSASNEKAFTRVDAFLNKPLSPAQLKAIALLAEGKSDAEVARLIGYNRQTVNRWRLYHPVFLSRLNRARAAVWSNTLDRLRSSLPDAVEALIGALRDAQDSKDRIKAALMLLKIAGTSRLAPRVGATNAWDCFYEYVMHRRNRDLTPQERKVDTPITGATLESAIQSLLSSIENPQTSSDLPDDLPDDLPEDLPEDLLNETNEEPPQPKPTPPPPPPATSNTSPAKPTKPTPKPAPKQPTHHPKKPIPTPTLQILTQALTPTPSFQFPTPHSPLRNPQSAIRNPQSAIRNPQSPPPPTPHPSPGI